MNRYEKYLEEIKSSTPLGTFKTYKPYIAIGDYVPSKITKKKLEELILSYKPKNIRSITTICNAFSNYAKHINSDHLLKLIADIDRNKVWVKAKPIAEKKYISHKEYKNAYKQIGLKEEFNILFFKALFRCLYEGIYSDDMSVLKNLRGRDITGNIVTLHEDNGNAYTLKISTELADMLKELSHIYTWERKNRNGSFCMPTTGIYFDSCFKVEIRKNSEYSYRFSYYRVLRKITEEYVGCQIKPFDIYISGIMYRICLKLKKEGISIADAFADENRNRVVVKVLSEELKRCNYSNETRNFRELIKGHLDIFDN